MLWERSIREDSPPFCSTWQSIDISDSVGGSTARQTCSRDYYDRSSPLLAVSSSQRGVIPCMLDLKPCMGSSNMQCSSIREDPNCLERCLCNLLVALEIFPCRLDPRERSCPRTSDCQCQDYGADLLLTPSSVSKHKRRESQDRKTFRLSSSSTSAVLARQV
ncbi:uncharacterized protein LOC143161608 isoform X2 [Aptenodytes patagonicus]|uniref:uncharacterized protein LOC143161608 isoform X2 n=1 Tax=Aptenodytes patagonicus TaxID=9234 RepID=UPI003F9EBE9E